MRLTFIALGSTGDILPYATLARALQDVGYRPTFVTSQDYQPLLDKMGVAGRYVPGDARKTIAQAGADMRRLMLAFAELSRGLPAILDPSRPWLHESRAIINQLPIGLYGFDLAEKLGVPQIRVAVIPLTPTAEFPMMGWPTSLSFLPGYNKLGYRLYERLTFLTMTRTIKQWRHERLGLPPISGSTYLAQLNRQPLLYGYSPQVVPRPLGWPDHIHVTGYWQPNDESWQPPLSLADFLEAGSAPVFIGFGSMPVGDPRVTTQMILDAVNDTGNRAIIQAGWAGLGQGNLPENVYRLEYAPYSWLFPRMAAVIHHGGSGTTAAGLIAGVPSMIVPFTFDQGFWGRRLAELAVGLPPIPIGKLSTAELADTMVQLTTDDALMGRAAELGKQIRTEDEIGNAIRLIIGYLDRT